MAAAGHIAADRVALYQALNRRNRIVGLMRWLVPVIGALVLAALLIQMVIANLTKDFSIGKISLERDRLRVETPSYSGRMDDGSTYEVSAAAAETALAAMNLIDLTGALVVVNRSNGVQTTATSTAAQIESDKQQVKVDGITELSDTMGMTGEVGGMQIDFLNQKLSSEGEVNIEFAGGETLRAARMTYDAVNKLWTFSRVTLTLRGVPGGDLP